MDELAIAHGTGKLLKVLEMKAGMSDSEEPASDWPQIPLCPQHEAESEINQSLR